MKPFKEKLEKLSTHTIGYEGICWWLCRRMCSKRLSPLSRELSRPKPFAKVI